MPRSFPLRAGTLAACGLWTHAAVAGGALLCGTAADELVAARAGLTREWVVQIPFDSAGYRLEHLAIGDGMVVATSGDGGVHAVATTTGSAGAARPGSVLWSQRVGRPGGSGQSAGIGAEIVTIARDLDIHGLDAADGSVRWRRSFGRPASGAAVPVGDWVYNPLSGDGVMRMPTNPNARPKPVAGRADDDRDRQPADDEETRKALAELLRPIAIDASGRVESAPVPYEGGVVWCTEGGRIVAVIPIKSGWERMEFDLNSSPAGPLVVRGSTIYAATRRGDLARIDDVSREDVHDIGLTWHVVLPHPPEGGPLVGGDTVAVSLGDEGIMAFSTQTGDERWRSCVAGRLVSVTGDRVWCVDRVGRLASLDLATGMPSEWMCLGSFTLPVANTVNDRLILASADGLVVSLAPRRTVSALPPPAPPKPNWKPADDVAPPTDDADAADAAEPPAADTLENPAT
jgi:outer membrane protein assembly factor BamB